jgi:hypothetical protein
MNPEHETGSSSWDAVSKQVAATEDPGPSWLQLHTGVPVVVAFIGDPWTYEALWTTRWERFDPNDPLHAGCTPRLRIALACYDMATGKVCVMEGDVPWFKDVLRLREKYGLDGWCFELTLHDAETEPCPTISVLREQGLTLKERAHIGALPRYGIESLYEDRWNAARPVVVRAMADAGECGTCGYAPCACDQK